jgi:CRP-like cAMP-binding protein
MDTQAIDAIPFLRGASGRGRARVLEKTTLEDFEDGAVIFREGDPPDLIYVIASGTVDVIAGSEDGEDEVQRTLGPGRLLGELGILGGHARTATARAAGPCELWGIERDMFLELYETEPAVSIEVATAMSTYLLDAEVIAEDLLFLDLEGRVAKRLLAFLDASGTGVHLVTATAGMSTNEVEDVLQKLARAMSEPQPYSKLDRLAMLSGGSRRAVTRILAEMQSAGVLIATEGNLIVIDKAKLEALAQYR